MNVRPKPTLFKDISDREALQKNAKAVGVRLKDFPITIMTYENAFAQDRYISNTIQIESAWEPQSVNKLCRRFKKAGAKGIFVDVGGNIGTYTLPLANCMREAGSKAA